MDSSQIEPKIVAEPMGPRSMETDEFLPTPAPSSITSVGLATATTTATTTMAAAADTRTATITTSTFPSASASTSPTQDMSAEESTTAASSSSKRPLMTKTKDGEPLSEKRLRRLEKNRLSARECRRRKREATENLERQINVLEGDNLKLRLQLQIGEEAEESSRQEQDKLTESLDSLLKSGASESEIFAKIEEYKEKFADYGRDRRSAIEFHLRNIERLLMPTQTTSVVLATLQGGAAVNSMPKDANNASATAPSKPSDVSKDSTSTATTEATASSTNGAKKHRSGLDPKSLFQFLVQTLEVSPEQSMALKDSRFVAKEMDECLQQSLSVLKELSSRLTQCGEDLETEFNNIRSILTPTQAAKFLVWVANNSACMYMLNELWNKVYTQNDTSDVATESEAEAK